jgi:hypothetical protein
VSLFFVGLFVGSGLMFLVCLLGVRRGFRDFDRHLMDDDLTSWQPEAKR